MRSRDLPDVARGAHALADCESPAIQLPLGLVERVEARTVEVALETPSRIARRDLIKRSYTLVRVVGPDEIVGIGFCLSGRPATAIVRDLIAPLVRHTSVYQNEGTWDQVYYDIMLNGRRGAALRALAAVDVAVWDLKGKLTGLPCAHLMGLYRNSVPAYASGGYYFDDVDPTRAVEEEVSAWLEQGYSAVKIKIGGAPLEVDVARVAAARRLLGDHGQLMLDANNAWRDAFSARNALARLEDFRVTWVEEPLSPDDVYGHRELRERCRIPIATGEIEATRWGFAPLIRERAADVIQPDAAVVGGLTEWRRIANTAASFDLPVAPHWFSDLHVHCVASAPNALWIEHFTDRRILNVMELFEQSLIVKDGWAKVPEEPGLGILLDDASVEGHALDGWS